uniref:uncharacterized protein LOC114585668 isoform X2 n=1 Tax=Podarcis muralis TaxID=64176 RepID=UPI0010A0513B|nr:uncharacterized protein LOC114585668 isoform X2 [Podarcis muralis]
MQDPFFMGHSRLPPLLCPCRGLCHVTKYIPRGNLRRHHDKAVSLEVALVPGPAEPDNGPQRPRKEKSGKRKTRQHEDLWSCPRLPPSCGYSIFKFKNGKLSCANPDDKWVHDLVAHVDKLYERPSPDNY